MGKKIMIVDPEKCTGCRNCELVCSVRHNGVSSPSLARIHVVKWDNPSVYIPMRCQQCEDAPCMDVCPVKALSRDEDFGYVMISYEVCIGCRSCVAVCPFGAINYNNIDKKVFKCDLCGGDPQCVRFCDMKAVDFVDADRISVYKKKNAAERLHTAQASASAIETSS